MGASFSSVFVSSPHTSSLTSLHSAHHLCASGSTDEIIKFVSSLLHIFSSLLHIFFISISSLLFSSLLHIYLFSSLLHIYLFFISISPLLFFISISSSYPSSLLHIYLFFISISSSYVSSLCLFFHIDLFFIMNKKKKKSVQS